MGIEIGDWDGCEIWDWDWKLGLETGIGDWDWGLGLNFGKDLGIEGLGFGMGIGDWGFGLAIWIEYAELELGI